MDEKNYSIEFLRVVFTIYIVLRHTLAATGIYPRNCLWLGVEFFFVLSGFLLTMTFRPERRVVSFVLSRYVRFVPLTVIGCVLCALFVVPYPLKVIANVLLLSETGVVVCGGAFNPPTWYLSVLLWGGVFYLLLFRLDKNFRALALFLIVIFGISSLRHYGYEPIAGEITVAGFSHRFVRGVVEMGLGCATASMFLKYREFSLPRVLTNVLEVASFALALLGPFAPIWDRTGWLSILLLNDAILIVLFVSRKGLLSRLLNKPYWGTVSRYALALFCTHYVTIFAINKFGCANDCGERAVVACGAVAVSLILAVVAHHVVERPCNRIFKELRINRMENVGLNDNNRRAM